MIEDWKINSQVIALLTKNWIDLRRLNITTINGVVYIRGLLVFYYDAEKQRDISSLSKKETIEEEKIKKIEKQLKKIPGVRSLKLEFINWVRESGRWKKRIK